MEAPPRLFSKVYHIAREKKAEKCRERALLPSGIAGFLGYRFLQRLRHFSQKTGRGTPRSLTFSRMERISLQMSHTAVREAASMGR